MTEDSVIRIADGLRDLNAPDNAQVPTRFRHVENR
jgi:hypothetical protein